MSPFYLRRKSKARRSVDIPMSADDSVPYEPYFGEPKPRKRGSKGSQTKESKSLRENGEEVLLKFIKNRLGTEAEGYVIRLMNKNPLKEGNSFSYEVNQTTEDTDLQIILRDLTDGRLYRSGSKFLAGAWANLLLGGKFAADRTKRQSHELVYTRTSCSCIRCLIGTKQVSVMGDAPSEEELASERSTASSYTPQNSAMANFVRPYNLPTVPDLISMGGVSSWRELEIGTITRLHSRSAAKLKFTDDMKHLFGHLSYTGPLSHEAVYRKITTIGVNYYLYNKGKKERKVYLQGDLVEFPLQMGITKLGTRPLRLDELGAYYLLYKKQTLKIYSGDLVLEGNSFGSFISTGIRFYIGVGEEDGCAPIYPNGCLGSKRRLGVNELLLHHHMVDDLQIRIL